MSVKVQTYTLELKAQAERMAVEDGLGIKEPGSQWYSGGWVAKVSKKPRALAPGEQIVQVAEMKRLKLFAFETFCVSTHYSGEKMSFFPKSTPHCGCFRVSRAFSN